MSPKEPILVLLAAGAAGGGLWGVAYGMDYRAAPALCVVVGLAVGLSLQLARQVVPPPELLPQPLRDESRDEFRDEGLLPLASLESRLSWGGTDPDRFRHRVRPELVALAADLLRTRRGVDLRTEPDRARSILGEPLWQLITRTPTRSPSRAELSRLVDALERI